MAQKTVNVTMNPVTPGLVFLIFLVLKLTEVINWSWWWVTAPLWGPALFAVAIFSVAGLIIGICALFGKRAERSHARYLLRQEARRNRR